MHDRRKLLERRKKHVRPNLRSTAGGGPGVGGFPPGLTDIRVDLAADMAEGIAPTLNDLMTVVWGNISLAEFNAERGEDPTSALESAQDACNQIREFLQNLGRLAPRVEADLIRPVDLKSLVEGFASARNQTGDVRLQVESEPDAPHAAGDAALIHRVLEALCQNSEESMPAGGTIKLRVYGMDNGMAAFSIEDAGVGIAPKFLGRVFDPFFSTKRRGRGLGLAMVMAAVRRMKGEVSIESEMGKGTTVTVALPAASPSSPYKGNA